MVRLVSGWAGGVDVSWCQRVVGLVGLGDSLAPGNIDTQTPSEAPIEGSLLRLREETINIFIFLLETLGKFLSGVLECVSRVCDPCMRLRVTT